jgi:ribonuclease R
LTREEILAHVARPHYQPGKMKELARQLGVSQTEYRAFSRLVKELEREGRLVRGRHNRYLLPGAAHQVVGRLRVYAKGFGRVSQEGDQEDIFLPPQALGGALDGDLVRVEITTRNGRQGGPEGRVIEVVEQGRRQFVGTFCRRRGRPVVEVEDRTLGRDVLLESGDGLQEGHLVVVQIEQSRWGQGVLQGKVVEVLGDPEDPRLDFVAVIRRFDLPWHFPPEVEAEAAQMPSGLEPELARRRDLRSWVCFTIDPVEAGDFDDAVSLEKRPQGGYLLGVHIADVSHFVRPGTAVDREALRRGTSAYLLDRAIHMLPRRLAADLCTLAPLQDRLTASVLMELNEAGQLLDFELVESVICSRARLTYEEVQALFDDRPDQAGSAAPLAESLVLMRQLSRQRTQWRRSRGALDLDVPEARVELDPGGRPTRLGRYPRYESHRLIEEFMLLANECVGRFMSQRRLPVLYRIHRPPQASKLKELAGLVSGSRFRLEGADEIRPKDLQNLLEQVQGRREAPLINKLLLRALARAEYAAQDQGHFGLACRHYLHFTSPIRRYPDLLVHRMLKAALRRQAQTGEAQGPLEELGRWTSACERRAEEAERAFVKMKQMRYMAGRVGEEFSGLVSGVHRGGFFAEVADFLVEGFCSVRDLGERFEFDPQRHRLVGSRSRRVFQLGTPVRVVIAGVSAQDMDLVLAEKGQEGRSSRGKGR